jgi:hypothetical protein
MSTRKVIPMPEPEEPTEETPRLSPEQARAMLDADKRFREQACLAEIGEVLKKHRCAIMAQASIAPDGRIVARPVVSAEE